MNKYYLPLGIILCLLIGGYLGFILGRSGFSATGETRMAEKESTDISTSWQNGILLTAPTDFSDCAKLSDTEKENCAFSVVVRKAKNASDISACDSLRDPTKCKKAITDEFSNNFNILWGK